MYILCVHVNVLVNIFCSFIYFFVYAMKGYFWESHTLCIAIYKVIQREKKNSPKPANSSVLMHDSWGPVDLETKNYQSNSVSLQIYSLCVHSWGQLYLADIVWVCEIKRQYIQ